MGGRSWSPTASSSRRRKRSSRLPQTAPIFRLAPALALIPYFVAMVAIPIGPDLVGQELDAGVFFVLAVMGVGVIGTLMAGWASANKYSLLGAVRQVSQLMAYELPFVLAAASVVDGGWFARIHRHRRGVAALVADLAASGRRRLLRCRAWPS